MSKKVPQVNKHSAAANPVGGPVSGAGRRVPGLWNGAGFSDKYIGDLFNLRFHKGA